MITIWKFDEAPEDYRNMTSFGGDKNYIIFAKDNDPSVIKILESKALGKYEEGIIIDGGMVFISRDEWGAHE